MTIAENPRANTGAKPSAPHSAAPILTTPPARVAPLSHEARIAAVVGMLQVTDAVRARIRKRLDGILTREVRAAERLRDSRPQRILTTAGAIIAESLATLTEEQALAKRIALKRDRAEVMAEALKVQHVIDVEWIAVLKSGATVTRAPIAARSKAEAKTKAIAEKGLAWNRAAIHRAPAPAPIAPDAPKA